MNQKTIQKILELKQKGYSIAEIANHFGITTKAVEIVLCENEKKVQKT